MGAFLGVSYNGTVNCKDYIMLVKDTRKSMEHWWNYTNRRKLMYLEKHLSQYHFIHQKSHLDWPRIKPGNIRK